MPTQRRMFAGCVAIFAILAAIGAVVWVLVLVRNEESPIEPTPGSVASPDVSPVSSPPATQVATPVPTISVVPTVVPGSLPDLLRYAPDRLANDSLPLSDIARYTNIEEWMSARNISTPVGTLPSAEDPWERELDALAIPEVMHARGTEPVWRDTYGFQLADVDAILTVGQAPDFVIIMRGDFDGDALHAAWAQSGYQAIREQGYTIWSLFPGDTVDLSAPASRPALGNMNNVVLLDDGTLIATSRLARMNETLLTVRGEASSLARNPSVEALLAPGAGAEELATAVILKGSVLSTASSTPAPMTATPPDVVRYATSVATPRMDLPMPSIDLMLAGLSPPETADALPIFSLVVSYETAEDATIAMSRVDRNLRQDISDVTGRPFAERLQVLDTRVVDTDVDRVLLLVRTRPLNGTADWLVIIGQRDLGFLSWPWDEAT